MLWHPFFARVKINYRSIYSHILTRMHAVAMATGLVNGFCLCKKIYSLDYFHNLPTTISHEIPSASIVLIKFWQKRFLYTRRKSSLQFPPSKFRFFCNRSFTWFLNFCFAKFLDILTTASFEIGKVLQEHFVSVFRATTHALHLSGFFR